MSVFVRGDATCTRTHVHAQCFLAWHSCNSICSSCMHMGSRRKDAVSSKHCVSPLLSTVEQTHACICVYHTKVVERFILLSLAIAFRMRRREECCTGCKLQPALKPVRGLVSKAHTYCSQTVKILSDGVGNLHVYILLTYEIFRHGWPSRRIRFQILVLDYTH